MIFLLLILLVVIILMLLLLTQIPVVKEKAKGKLKELWKDLRYNLMIEILQFSYMKNCVAFSLVFKKLRAGEQLKTPEIVIAGVTCFIQFFEIVLSIFLIIIYREKLVEEKLNHKVGAAFKGIHLTRGIFYPSLYLLR